MKTSVKLFVALCLVAAGSLLAADSESHQVQINITSICLLDIDDATALIYGVNATQAGDEPEITVTSGSETRDLWYTSIVPTGQTRRITANFSVALPTGVEIEVDISTADVGGVGAKGTGGSYTFDNGDGTSAHNIVTAIGNCWTSRTNGADVTISADISDVTTLVGGTAYTGNLTYTLTDPS
jgi:hypothetical protein